MGWIGPTKQVLFYLDSVNADRDHEGAFLISGAPVVFGLGGEEAVVRDETKYYVQGQPKMLASGLNTTSFGVNVKVL